MNKLCEIRDLQHRIIRFEQSFKDRFGIDLNEGMTLCSIENSETGKLSAGELSGLLGLTPSNMSKVTASAEKKGLIDRTMGDNDKRLMYFALTPAGHKLIKSIKSVEDTMEF